MNKQLLIGYISLFAFVICSTVWFLMYEGVFILFPELDVFSVAFWSSFNAFVLLTPFFFWTKKPRRQTIEVFRGYWKVALLLGGLGLLAAYCLIYSTEVLNSGIASLFMRTDVVWGFLLGVIFLRERAALLMVLGALIAIAGFVSTKIGSHEYQLSGILLGVLGGFFLSFHSLFTKKLTKNVHPIYMAYWRLGAIVFFSLPIFLLLAHQVVISYTPMLYLALIGCVGIFLNRVFFIHAHKFLGISHVAVTLLLVPLCTLLGSYVIFGNVFNPVQIFGSGTILLGIGVFIYGQSRSKKGS